MSDNRSSGVLFLASLGLALTAAGLGLAKSGLGAPATATELLATVGPRQTISLRLLDGTAVTRIRAGRYTIVVNDQSRRDDFHLTGSIDLETGIAFVGTRRWSVRLRKGTYRYLSDAHPRTLRASFRVY
jgi:hypothetical protein